MSLSSGQFPIGLQWGTLKIHNSRSPGGILPKFFMVITPVKQGRILVQATVAHTNTQGRVWTKDVKHNYTEANV